MILTNISQVKMYSSNSSTSTIALFRVGLRFASPGSSSAIVRLPKMIRAKITWSKSQLSATRMHARRTGLFLPKQKRARLSLAASSDTCNCQELRVKWSVWCRGREPLPSTRSALGRSVEKVLPSAGSAESPNTAASAIGEECVSVWGSVCSVVHVSAFALLSSGRWISAALCCRKSTHKSCFSRVLL